MDFYTGISRQYDSNDKNEFKTIPIQPSLSENWATSVLSIGLVEYRLFPFKRTHADAKEICRSYDAILPEIRSMGDNEFLLRISHPFTVGSDNKSHRLWLGHIFSPSIKQWLYLSSNQKIEWQNWIREPNKVDHTAMLILANKDYKKIGGWETTSSSLWLIKTQFSI